MTDVSIKIDDDNDDDIEGSSSSSPSPIHSRRGTVREKGEVAILWHSLSYAVETTKWQRCKRTKHMKTLLSNVSGCVRRGETVALLGGSGAGKTTLLNLLAQRVTNTKHRSGVLLYNGESRSRLSTDDAAYVMQTDVALPNLTVRETLLYAARLRLVETTPQKELEERVDALIEELGLVHCAHTRVGNELVRGVSGGELRRLSIAQELINDPDFLFLDEPTSGLDSSAAYNLARLLRRLARNRNQAVISSIHQPSPQTFALFDKVLLLSKSRDNVGRVAYFGPTSELQAYLEHEGLAPRPGYAIADHIIDLANANAKKATDNDNDNDDDDDDDDDGELRNRTLTMTAMPSEAMTNNDIVEIWERSDSASDVEEMLRKQIPEGAGDEKPTKSRTRRMLERRCHNGVGDGDNDDPQFKTGFINQVRVFTQRSFVDMIRAPDFVFSRLVKMHFIGFIAVTMWLQLDYSPTGIQNRISALFFSLLSLFMLAQGYIPVLIQMRAITARERNSKLYSAFAQMCGLIVSQVPIDFANALVLATYIYWGIGFRSEFVAYLQYLAVYAISELFMVGTILSVSAVSMSGEQATILASLTMLPMILTLGFFALDMPSYWSWMRYINPLRYALSALLWNEFHGLVFDCSPGEQCTFTSGDQLLEFYDVSISGTGEFWLYTLIIGVFVLVVTFLLYLAIRFAKFEKR